MLTPKNSGYLDPVAAWRVISPQGKAPVESPVRNRKEYGSQRLVLLCNMIALVLGLALVGFLVWLITTYIPMPPQIKSLIIIIVVVMIVLYLLQVTGIMGWGPPVPHAR